MHTQRGREKGVFDRLVGPKEALVGVSLNEKGCLSCREPRSDA